MSQISIFILENCPAEIELTNAALEASKVFNKIHCERDVENSIKFFKKAILKGDIPDLVLIDLNLDHGETGIDFIKWIRSREELFDISIVICSGVSNSLIDKAMLNLNVDLFIEKPLNLEKIKVIIEKFDDLYILLHSKKRSLRG